MQINKFDSFVLSIGSLNFAIINSISCNIDLVSVVPKWNGSYSRDMILTLTWVDRTRGICEGNLQPCPDARASRLLCSHSQPNTDKLLL